MLAYDCKKEAEEQPGSNLGGNVHGFLSINHTESALEPAPIASNWSTGAAWSSAEGGSSMNMRPC